MSKNPSESPDKPQGLLATIASVAAAFFGVQSARNRQRDDTRGKPLHFVLVGLAMTAVFVGVIVLAVRLALRSAGL